MMKRTVVIALVLVACGKSGGEHKEQAKSTEKAAPTPAKVEEKAAKPAEPTVTSEQRQTYRKHLRAGRKLGKQERWGEAVVELEAALVAIPMDGRALSELGWAAFQAGDYDKAKKANQDSARVAVNPKVKAASLYNLGRVAEAMKDNKAAAGYYRESLKLRPHKAVAARLEKLGGEPPVPGSADTESLPCVAPVASPEQVCACLGKQYEAAEEDGGGQCEKVPFVGPDEVGVVRVEISDSQEFEYFLLYQTAKGWVTIADLGYLFAGGIAGIENEMEVSEIVKKSAGPRSVLWVEVLSSGHDNDLGIAEVEFYDNTRVTLCVLADEGAPVCPLQLPLSSSYTREELDEDIAGEVEEDVADLRTPGLPIHTERAFEVRLGEDGTATVVLVKGEADPETKPMLGPHKLW